MATLLARRANRPRRLRRKSDSCDSCVGFTPATARAVASPLAVPDRMPDSGHVERSDAELIRAVLKGDTPSFEPLVKKYSPRLFATARRYARREDEIEDIVQEIWSKAFHKLASFRGDAPFEHWLMRMAVRTCYDFLREHQRNRENTFTELTTEEDDWVERVMSAPEQASEHSDAAKQLVEKLMSMLSPPARLIIQLLEIDDRSVKEISYMTGWSVPLVKVRAFRARAEMKKCLARIARDKYL
jgi:RNA polymerase sigma-70 factor (ECF subfamily)